MIGGGAGVAPSTITTGTGVVTALGVNTGSAGAFVTFNGALGTPSSGVATNLTGTASGLSIGGNAATATSATTATTATTATNATNTAITDNTSSSATWYPTIVSTTTGNLPQTTSSTKLSFVPSTGILSATGLTGALNGSLGATTPSTASVTTLTIGTTQLGAGNASIMKNRIINGAMVIDQRNAGASVTVTTDNTQFSVDRFILRTTVSSKYSAQQNAGSVTPPVGFSNYLGITSLAATSLGVTDYYAVEQRIEAFNYADLNWGAANAKTVTLSFWVYSSLIGTFGGNLRNSASTYFYPFSYTISSANTWTQISVTIVGPTSGTWVASSNGTGIQCAFSLGTGSSYSQTAGSWTASAGLSTTGATSVVGTNGATFYITGVQLEVGSSATGFEYVNYQTSLANCQRYYWKVVPDGGTICGFGSGQFANSTTANIIFNYPVTMRTAPTMAYGGTYNINGAGSAYAVSAITGYTSSTSGRADFTVSGATAGQGAAGWLPNATTNFITASAEL
jgi:hypothetical protein